MYIDVEQRKSAKNIKIGRIDFFVVIVIMYLPSRFQTKDDQGWRYSFNPCMTFKMGSKGNCKSDVAVSL